MTGLMRVGFQQAEQNMENNRKYYAAFWGTGEARGYKSDGKSRCLPVPVLVSYLLKYMWHKDVPSSLHSHPSPSRVPWKGDLETHLML